MGSVNECSGHVRGHGYHDGFGLHHHVERILVFPHSVADGFGPHRYVHEFVALVLAEGRAVVEERFLADDEGWRWDDA